jgi:hypothetical protein
LNGLNGVPARPYLTCDYNTRTCVKGYAVVGPTSGVVIFVGALVDGDNRQVELRHLKCFNNFHSCNDYDRGISFTGGIVEKPDMSPACVELMRTTGRFDSGKEPCLGYGHAAFQSPTEKAKSDAENAVAATEQWRIEVTRHILQYQIRMNAKTTIKIEIDRNGDIKSAVEVGSGKDQFDTLAQTWRLNHLPPPPASVKGGTVTLIALFDRQTTQPFITIQN